MVASTRSNAHSRPVTLGCEPPVSRWIVVAASALGLAAPGCSVPAPRSQPPSADALVARLREQQRCAAGLQGDAKVDVVTQRGRVKGDVYLFAVSPDRVRFDVVSPFGATIFTLTSDGRTFELADQEQKAFFTGPASACNLARFTQVPVPGHALASLLRGQPPVLVHEPDSARFEWDGAGHYQLTIPSRHEATEALRIGVAPEDHDAPFERQRLRLLGVRVEQRAEVLYDVELGDHAVIETAPPRIDEDGLDEPIPPSGPPCSAEVPRRVGFRVPRTDDDVLFELRDAKWNPPLLPDTFTQPVPAGMKVVRVSCE
jgi:hypothetical protein